MGKNNTIIEINGKRYNANSGRLIKDVTTPSAAPALSQPVHRHTTLVRAATIQPTMSDVVRKPAKHQPAHAPVPGKTLMRHAVKKPLASKAIKAQATLGTVAKQPASGLVATKKSVHQLDDKRLQRARRTAKSEHIKKFSKVAATPAAYRHIEAITQRSHSFAAQHVGTQHAKHPTTTAELLEHALKHATSHEQPPHELASDRRNRRYVGIGVAAVLTIAVIGVVGSQNLPALRLQMASAKAGFSASLPGYKPAGYSLGALNYSSGVVASSFKSNSDDRSYEITQKRSNWNSASLRDLFVAPRDDKFQTVQSGGQTIYIYGDQSATWVDDGIWYQVQSYGSLNNRQLVELASSL